MAQMYTLPSEFSAGAEVRTWLKMPGDPLTIGDEVVEIIVAHSSGFEMVVLTAEAAGTLIEHSVSVETSVMPGECLFVWEEGATQDLSSRIDRLLIAARDAGIYLRPGASEAELDEAERRVGATLPASFRTLYRKFDGCDLDPEYFEPSALGNADFVLPLANIIDLQDMWREIRAKALSSGDRTSNGLYWHPSWVPITAVESYAHLVLDPVGCHGGTPGQILWFDYKSGPAISIAHASFDDWVHTLLSTFEAGLLFTPLDEMPFEDHEKRCQIERAINGEHQEFNPEPDVF